MMIDFATLASLRIAALVLVVLAAAVIDCRLLRIPNWLTGGAALVALALQALAPMHLVQHLLLALTGLALAFILMLPLYALGAMGAGDVKLLAAVGAFVGLADVLPVLACVLVAGGIAAIVFAAARRRGRRFAANVIAVGQGLVFAAAGAQPFTRLAPAGSVGKLPYGVSIAAGTIAFLLARRFHLF
jgi:prepilin peptidase CpaA